MFAIYQNGSERVEFKGGVEPPRDTSRDACAEIQNDDPLFEVRKDAESIQYQINQFLTEKMQVKQSQIGDNELARRQNHQVDGNDLESAWKYRAVEGTKKSKVTR